MNRRELVGISVFFLLIGGVFFYKTALHGFVPFPGDLLAAEYNPWRHYSYLGYNPGSIPHKAQYFDTLRQLYPWTTFGIKQLRELKIPLWNPHNFSGHPLLANSQSAVFYPVRLLYFIFPQINLWTIYIFLQPLLASFFTYLYARRIKLGKAAAAIAGLAYGYSLFMSVFLEYGNIGHTILWLPLALLLVEKLREKMGWHGLSGLIVVLVLSFSGGHLQIFGFLSVFILLYAFFRWRGRLGNLQSLGHVGVVGLGTLGLGAVQLLPTLELIQHSARVPQDYQFLLKKLLIQPDQLILLASPDFYGNPATRNFLLAESYPGNAFYIGLIPLVFALTGLVHSGKNALTRYYAGAVLILLFFLIRHPLAELFYKIHIPLFSTGSPNNAIFLLSFSLSILAGIGLDGWVRGENKNFSSLRITALILLILGLFGGLGYFRVIQYSLKNWIYSVLLTTGTVGLLSIFYFLSGYRRLAAMIFLVVTVADLFYFFHKFNPFIERELIYPPTQLSEFLQREVDINRIWAYGGAELAANVETRLGLYSPNGYDPLYPRRYGEFVAASKDGKLLRQFNLRTRSDAVITPGYGETDLTENRYRLRLLDVLGVKYILDHTDNPSSEQTFPPKRFRLVYEDAAGWRVFENTQALPRALLVRDYKVFKGKKEFEDLFFAHTFNPAETLLLEKAPRVNNGAMGQSVDEAIRNRVVEVSDYRPNKVTIRVQTDEPAFLFLSDTHFPGWKATVNGQPVEILRANYAFRAVSLDSGRHKVIFAYEPNSFRLGAAISMLSLISILPISYVTTKSLHKSVVQDDDE